MNEGTEVTTRDRPGTAPNAAPTVLIGYDLWRRTFNGDPDIVDPTAAIENVRTMDDVRAECVSSQMFATRLLVGFAGAAIVLALVGLYGVLSWSVASRRREIAIRSAIGAQRGHIRALIIGEGVRVVLWRLVGGTALALALGRIWRVFLYGVQPSDPMTLVGASFAFLLVAAVAWWAPAARATAVDPMEALRSE